MKKLLTATLAVALVFGATSAVAQNMTMAVSVKVGTEYQQVATVVTGAPFTIAVWGNTDGISTSAAEFVVTELLQTYAAGMFKTGTVKILNTPLDLGNNSLGEYLLAFGACVPASPQLELVAVNYFPFASVIAPDTVMNLRGFQPGDTRPSSFFGSVGFVDCVQTKITASVGGVDGGYTGTLVEFADGLCVLNATPMVVDNDEASFGQIKARF